MFQFSRNPRGHPLLNQGQLDILSRANRQVASKKPSDAGKLFAQLAQEMEATDHPRRAANFHALAAHSFADAQDEKRALAHAQNAITLFSEYLMTGRMIRFFTNITNKMHSFNMTDAVGTLQDEFGQKISTAPAPAAKAEPTQSARLPAACLKCGAPVHSTEVKWIDDQSAECIYCGSVLQTT